MLSTSGSADFVPLTKGSRPSETQFSGRDATPSGGNRNQTETTACMQLHNRFIVTSSQSGLMIISQHRAHVRILFENYMSQLAEGSISSQILLFPEDMELSPAQNATLTASLGEFEALGFNLCDNGDMRWSIIAVPSPLTSVSPLESVMSIIENITERGEADAETLRKPLALAMARSAAVQPGQPPVGG